MSEPPKNDKHWEQYRKSKENKTGIKSLFTSNIFLAEALFISQIILFSVMLSINRTFQSFIITSLFIDFTINNHYS